jgi:hypothetical protein
VVQVVAQEGEVIREEVVHKATQAVVIITLIIQAVVVVAQVLRVVILLLLEQAMAVMVVENLLGQMLHLQAKIVVTTVVAVEQVHTETIQV